MDLYITDERFQHKQLQINLTSQFLGLPYKIIPNTLNQPQIHEHNMTPRKRKSEEPAKRYVSRLKVEIPEKHGTGAQSTSPKKQ